MRYVLVTGGVMSGLGKGITASSTGVILQALGFNVTAIKIDPYLNVDAGTMSPFEHGEVFVTDDGGETDLDLGNYERFLDVALTRDHNITTGKLYASIIERERRGEFLGKTVQVIPHVTDALMAWVEKTAQKPTNAKGEVADICIIELGGTVGDIESAAFIEAFRQFQWKLGRENFLVVHVSLVPVSAGELKSKPTQASVRDLRALGLSPDVIVCRCSQPLPLELRRKIESFCHVSTSAVISCHDVSNTYAVPLLLAQQGMHNLLLQRFGLPLKGDPNMSKWERVATRMDSLSLAPHPKVIAMVGKYTGMPDTYLSILRALQHASMQANVPMKVEFVESTELEPASENEKPEAFKAAWKRVRSADAVLVPGGFGDRGVEGMILAAHECRVNKKPYLGICLGLQIAVIEFARNMLGVKGATSEEFSKGNGPNAGEAVVIFMPEGSRTHLGGTMRLGSRPTRFRTFDSAIAKLYRVSPEHPVVNERHRHRYEVNPAFVDRFEKAGMEFVGRDEFNERMEILNIPSHPFFVGTQYHPEFASRPFKSSAPFVGLLLAAVGPDAIATHLKAGVDIRSSLIDSQP